VSAARCRGEVRAALIGEHAACRRRAERAGNRDEQERRRRSAMGRVLGDDAWMLRRLIVDRWMRVAVTGGADGWARLPLACAAMGLGLGWMAPGGAPGAGLAGVGRT
jgi:hypothetical protein